MQHPHFLDIEYSSPDEDGFPTAIAWSLADGSIKSVFIVPDDEWCPWENSDADIDIQHLYDQGEAGTDVIRELNSDLSGQTVYVDGLDFDAELIEKLFETFGQDPDFEIHTARTLFPDLNSEEITASVRDIINDNQLDPTAAFDNVKAWLYWYAQIAPK